MGNRSQKTEGTTPTAYVYDNADRMTDAGGVAYGYDNNGNQTTRGADTFNWDIEDRMTGATVGGNAVSYAYRGDDLRHSKTVGAVTTVFTWDLNSELPMVLQEGTTSYVYGLGLISQTTGTTQSYFLADGLGSTAALTDDTGTVTATYKYDVFGAVKASTGTGSSDFRFAGQQDDPAVGFQYLRARYYDPTLGRFISKDPLDQMTLSAYSYPNSNPINLVDPAGQFGWIVAGAIIGGVSGAVGAMVQSKSLKDIAIAAGVGAAGGALLAAVGPAAAGLLQPVLGAGAANAAAGALLGAAVGGAANTAGQAIGGKGLKNFKPRQAALSATLGGVGGAGGALSSTVFKLMSFGKTGQAIAGASTSGMFDVFGSFAMCFANE